MVLKAINKDKYFLSTVIISLMVAVLIHFPESVSLFDRFESHSLFPGMKFMDVANEILRLKRIEAHQVFDAYWQKQHISRTKAYQWLARELKLSEEETHIGGVEIDTCQRVIDLCRAKMDKK